MSKRLGKWGEDIAAAFLVKKGYTPVEQNWRTRRGEIDLVMRLGKIFVFVEVKTRTGLEFGFPEESITPQKLGRLVGACEAYIEDAQSQDHWQIDFISIIGDPVLGIKEIRHFPKIEI